MLDEIKEQVFQANIQLVKFNLVILTWGNVSQITSDRKYVVIKPSGVPYESMAADQMAVTDLDGHVVDGNLRPSSDLLSHLEIYKAFPAVHSVVHTHSPWAVAWAQAERDLPCYGTTHADTFYGTVPCTRTLTAEEVSNGYEINTGKVIVETFRKRGLDPDAVPAVLVSKHGPFVWGKNTAKAVETALILEETAKIALLTQQVRQDVAIAPDYLLDKHYLRKHGLNAYYGQEHNV